MSVLEKFKLVELITSRTDSVATFMNGNQIKFNAATFVDLGYPEYIQLFVEEKGKQFAIKACKADAPQAIKFSKPAGEQRYPIKISCAPAANAVRRVMQWAPEESWNVPGAIFGEEKVIIYSLEQAYAPVPKGGWTEAIFAKAKPAVERVRMRFEPEDSLLDKGDDDMPEDDNEDEELPETKGFDSDDDDDDYFDEDKLTEESYRTTYEASPEELEKMAREGVSDDGDDY